MQPHKCLVLTHRGLENSNLNFYPESSYESFKSQLERGFGIEFDVNFAKDGIFIFHDSNLKRITNEKDNRLFSDLNLKEIKKIRFGKKKQGRFAELQEILDLIRKSNSEINALHLKGRYQTQIYLDLLLNVLKENKNILNKILIIDIKPETAFYLKYKLKGLILAPSVAHSYDIKRYSSLIDNTLISIKEALDYKKENLYDWVWLDEWDLLDENGQEKRFYTEENFQLLKNKGYKIGLVTPELHSTSPGLYGGESHQDAKDEKKLLRKIKDILSLQPDAVCTDYPEEVRNMIFT